MPDSDPCRADPSTGDRATDLTGAIAAATVIIARNGARGLEVLAIERAKGMGFAGGMMVFPGGKIDATDQPAGPSMRGFETLFPADAVARIAAAREAFEEAGILLSTGPDVSEAERRRLRPASDRHDIAFHDLLADIGHVLDAASLTPFARWLPPAGIHKRFDTRFYLAALPAGEAMCADGHEAVHALWARPADLLADADAGRLGIIFPTRCNLARLARFDSVAALLADPTPPPFVHPRVVDGRVRIPDNIGYPYTSEQLETATGA